MTDEARLLQSSQPDAGDPDATVPKHESAGGLRTFLGAWLRNPVRTGAVAPSSRALARLITSRIEPDDAPVIELGPGTGVLTQGLLERGVREADLVLVEYQRPLVDLLRRRFPNACVLHLDAALLAAVDPLRGRLAGAAVSGLPILWMGEAVAERILRGLFARMQPGAALFQFTYQLYCPVPRHVLARLGLRAERVGWTLANLPPAAVYRIIRAQADSHAGRPGG